MTLDLLALGLVALFALWGAFTGFARQVAQAVAVVAAFTLAVPAGNLLAPTVANALKATLTVGAVAGTVAAFAVIYLGVRAVLTNVVKKLLAKKDEDGGENHSTDRAMGFGLATLKAVFLVWVTLSAATFVEKNLVLNGRRFEFTPRDSRVAELVRGFNLIEKFQFAGGKDLALAAKLASDPSAAAKLKDDPDYAALMKDARFKYLVASPAWKTALNTGDVTALMQSQPLLELVRDGKTRPHIERLAQQAQSR